MTPMTPATATSKPPPTAPHTAPDKQISVSTLRRPTYTIATLSGDLDVATAPALRERLTALLHPGMRRLVLDLSEVVFCDAAALAVLIGTQRRAAREGITVHLAAPRHQVTKILRVTGLDRALNIHPTLAAALPPPG
jgi:anti-anti-sigma factor